MIDSDVAGRLRKAVARKGVKFFMQSAVTMSAQAVGGAVGRNPISIVIPCHRLVGADGGLTGYAAGVAVKARLLALEGHANLT